MMSTPHSSAFSTCRGAPVPQRPRRHSVINSPCCKLHSFGRRARVERARVQGPVRRTVAPDETVTLLHPLSTFSRCFNRDGEGMSAE